MKRSPSAARSYLQQLIEPVPQQSALLTTHRSAFDRRIALDAIPPVPAILDSISDSSAEAATPRRAATAQRPRSRREQTAFSQALPIDASIEPTTDRNHSSALSSRPGQRSKLISDTPLTTGEVLSRPGDATHEGPSARERLSPRNNATPQSEDLRQSFEPTPALAARIARDRSDRGSRGSHIHIGTVEVRTVAPAAGPQPPPAIDRSARAGRSGFAAEPLSRPLAWSHGLVQG